MPTPADERTEPPLSGDDRTLLTTFLDYHRHTLQWKCAGLSPAQLATPAVAASELTLLGLVRHLTEVERSWFVKFDGTVIAGLYFTDADPDGDFHVGDPDRVTDADVATVWAAWEESVDFSRRLTAATDLDMLSARRLRGEQMSMRWILIHMIEEYARHNGHADLIRQSLDGAVGE